MVPLSPASPIDTIDWAQWIAIGTFILMAAAFFRQRSKDRAEAARKEQELAVWRALLDYRVGELERERRSESGQ